MNNKSVCFFGHRYEWKNKGVEKPLLQVIEDLVKKGYDTFYYGDRGYFDKISLAIVKRIRKDYPDLKIYKVLTNYSPHSADMSINQFETSILPELEQYHYKQRLIKRNEWIIDNSDIVICHIVDTYRSGAYKAYLYAKKSNKRIILV